jgi:methyl-accepting chemotaxis protein
MKLWTSIAGRRLEALDRALAVITFTPKGEVLDVNETFLSVLGYQRTEVIGRHHRMFVPEQDAAGADYQMFWEALRRGEPQAAEFRRIGAGGREVWIQGTYSPVLDRRGRVVCVVKYATDVTARKAAEARTAAQVAAIQRAQAVVEFDTAGLVVDANANFLATVGYTREEIVGRHHRMFVDPAYADSPAYAAFWDSLRAGTFDSAEYKRFGKNRREIWIRATYNPLFDAAGRVAGVIKFATDITPEKLRSADNLSQIDALNRSQAVIQFTLDGLIVDANANFLEAMGYALEEIKGRHHSIFIPAEERDSREYREFWEKLRKGQFHASTYQRRDKFGRPVWLQASYNPILDADGRPCKVIKYATDITERMTTRAKMAKATSETHGNVEAVASAVEQLSASIGEIASHMARSSQAVKAISEQATIAEGSAAGLAQSSKSLSDVATFITSIADQINLLSLNATIEAARAGEAGRGFTVVAAEVKTLASQVAKATHQINDQIASMQANAIAVGGTLQEVARSVITVEHSVTSVAASLEEHRTVTEEIRGNMAQLVQVSDLNRSLSEWNAA